MKSTERHKLKENEFARSVGHARERLTSHRRELMAAIGALVLVVAALAGFAIWRASRDARANGSLAAALAIAEAPIVPPAAPAPGSEPPLPRPQLPRSHYSSDPAARRWALPSTLTR